MSLTDEQLIDLPVLVLPLHVEGAASDGQTVPDAGPNGLDGELSYSGSEQAWGYPSANEAAAAAREYRGYDAGINGLSGHSNIVILHDPLMAVTNDFAIEAIVRPQSDIPLAGTFALVQKQGSGGIALSTADSLATRLAGFCFDSAVNLWVVSDLTMVVTASLGQPYHVVVTRTGDVLAIRVNGVLKNTKTITSSLPTLANSSPFRVHLGAIDCRYGEAAWYTHSLSGTRTLVHYEAMINATLLSGTSNVIPSSILLSDVEPDPISFPSLRHNWSDSLIERISFRTARSTAVRGYTANNAQRPKPRREIEISQVLRDNDERQAFRAKLTAHQNAKWFIPILEDREWLSVQLSAGSTLMPADTQYRDYEVGGYVELRQLNNAGQTTKHEHVLITSLSPLTTTPTVATYDAGYSTICPARRGVIEAQVSPRGHTDAVEEMTLVVRLIAEDEQVVPNRITPWTPTITYHGYEVFDPAMWQSNDWTELCDYNVQRERHEIDFDTGQFTVESDTLAAVESFSYRMVLETRAQQAALLGWFYARAGSANYLWVPTVQRDFNVVSVGSSTVTVEKHNYFDNFAGSEFRRDLAFVYHDNTMALRRIVSVALAGANETLTFNTTVPTLTNLRSISYLRVCELDGDTLEIARVTDTKARFAWGFRELLSSPN